MVIARSSYVGRLAPSPTGYLHLGHARTFWIAAQRARGTGGILLLRNDDLDRARCRAEYITAMQEDLRWLGLDWDGPMISQSERLARYRLALERLHAAGLVFPCSRSRRDVQEAAGAPHEGPFGTGREGAEGSPDEPVYPREFRPSDKAPLPPLGATITTNWRFRVPDGEVIRFTDHCGGEQQAVAGTDFGDFLVWRKDNTPSYQLATVVDDAEFAVTEVVRGADLIQSTFRQRLLFHALGWSPPEFYHAPLILNEHGARLAKRHDALAIRTLRARGMTAEQVRESFIR